MSSLSAKLAQRQAAGNPISVGLIGAGKFGSMFLSQVPTSIGLHLACIADLSPQRALDALKRVNFPSERYSASLEAQPSIADAIRTGQTTITSDAASLIASPGIDILLECTGNPAAGIRHALLACEHKKHIVMVNVEADVLAGPLLARKAREAGIVYSMAYGDQPALISELVDWARTAGFHVVCAGKGTKHLPPFHFSTPETVWDHYGLGEQERMGLNPQMFNSFLDGTKSAIEMAAVSNACDLTPPRDGLRFPPCAIHDLPNVLRPKSVGGQLDRGDGTVEVVSCLELDGRLIADNLRWGVYVIIEAPGQYQKECFAQYGLLKDSTGRYVAQYKPYHLIGLELGISIANIMLRGEPTGQCRTWAADVIATAKRDLKTGDRLDGEGGFTVYGKLISAADSLKIRGLPIGLAHGVFLKRDMSKGKGLSWDDVNFDANLQAVQIRREMEDVFRREPEVTSTASRSSASMAVT